MGRTISFTITKPTKITDEEYRKACDISIKYNSGKFESVWTCDNFFWCGYEYYPNWDNKLLKGGGDKAWKLVNKKYVELEKKELYHIDIVKALKKDGLVNFYNDPNTNSGQGFVKVQGNEYNSLLVLMALIEISKAIPAAKINVDDEGEFLLCDLILQNGRANPNMRELIRDVEKWAAKIALSMPAVKRQLKTKGFDDLLQRELGFNSPYLIAESVRYLNESINKAKDVYEKIKNEGNIRPGIPLYFENIQNYKGGFNPMLFTRQVDVEKFINYKMSAGTLMDGFRGEGFGLNNKAQSELTSYEYIASLQKLLDKAGCDKNQVSILGVSNF